MPGMRGGKNECDGTVHPEWAMGSDRDKSFPAFTYPLSYTTEFFV